MENLNCEHILDAQDYLGNWHLSIVMEEKSPTTKMIHFLPFYNGKRDEEFTAEDMNRLGPAFSKSELTDPDSKFAILRSYYSKNDGGLEARSSVRQKQNEESKTGV